MKFNKILKQLSFSCLFRTFLIASLTVSSAAFAAEKSKPAKKPNKAATRVNTDNSDEDGGASNSNKITKATSEFFFQPAAGKHSLAPGLSYLIDSTETKVTTTSKAITSGPKFYFDYVYGFSSELSLGAGFVYAMLSTKVDGVTTETKTSGLEDFKFNGIYRLQAVGASWLLGADILLSLGQKTINANGDQSANSGGYSIAPFGGVEAPIAGFTMGGKVSYEILKGDRDRSNNTKRKGTETFAMTYFVEGAQPIGIWGANASYLYVSEEKDQNNVLISKALSDFRFKGYVTVTDILSGTLIPYMQFDYYMIPDNGTTTTKRNAFLLGLSGRWEI